jgi:hypothetical protein
MTLNISSLSPADSQQDLAKRMIAHGVPIQRTSWQSTSAPSPAYELTNVLLEFSVPDSICQWQEICLPDLPWAEEHFQERVSGIPHNPPPSSARWPWYSDKEREKFQHGEARRFDHTYPERFWPRAAARAEDGYLRNELTGDLRDVASLLRRDPWTRQAFLPVWFPEDTGSREGQRVPCTLGYHFVRNKTQLDCNYFIRSCDLTRHYLNDVYMTGRLLQWMVENVQNSDGLPYPGTLTMFVSNLHLFTADAWRFQ